MTGLDNSSDMHGFKPIKALDGAGRVWLALDTALFRHVALKFPSPDGAAQARDALLAEAGILSRCNHPAIVRLFTLIDDGPSGRTFYAMKAMSSSLSGRLSAGESFPDAAVRGIGHEVACALAHLHGLSPAVAHGSVRAEHILFDIADRPALAGFGSAREIADGDSAAMADDILALGKVLQEALTCGGRAIPRCWKPLLDSMLSADWTRRPSAAEVAEALAGTPPRSGFQRCLAAAACAVAAIAAAAICLRPSVPDTREVVVDEVTTPMFSSKPYLQPRLPHLSTAAMRRIPWYCHLHTNTVSSPAAQYFEDHLSEFLAAHPEPRHKFFAGMLRTIRLPGDVQLEMAAIPAGQFRRGFFLSGDSIDREESFVGPESVLVYKSFWMTRTEITRAQYAAVMRLAPAVAGFPARKLGRGEGRRGRPLEIEGGDLPVGEDLNLADVLRFIDALNALCKLEGVRRFRLPTEAEWEHACRAFVGRRFEGEGNPGDAAWLRDNSGGTPHPVALKAQNPLGLFDMHGNLAEWCADAYGPIEELEPFDPFAEPQSNSAPRVVRGGSFRDEALQCDSDARAAALPTDKGFAIRLVAQP